MLATRFLAGAALSLLGAGAALAGDDHRGRGRGYAPAPYRSAPAVISARVVDVEPLVRYVTIERPRERCWREPARRSLRPIGVVGQTATGGAGAYRRAAVDEGYATRGGVVRRCAVVNERVTERVVDGFLVTYRLDGRHYTMRTARHPGKWVQLAAQPASYRRARY